MIGLDLEDFISEMGYIWGNNNSVLLMDDGNSELYGRWRERLRKEGVSVYDYLDNQLLLKGLGALWIVNNVGYLSEKAGSLITFAKLYRKPVVITNPVDGLVRLIMDGGEDCKIIFYTDWGDYYRKNMNVGNVVYKKDDMDVVGVVKSVEHYAGGVKFSVLWEDGTAQREFHPDMENNSEGVEYGFRFSGYRLPPGKWSYISDLREGEELREDTVAILQNKVRRGK